MTHLTILLRGIYNVSTVIGGTITIYKL